MLIFLFAKKGVGKEKINGITITEKRIRIINAICTTKYWQLKDSANFDIKSLVRFV